MTGRATQRDRDLDDWFAEPDQVLHQAHRPLTRADTDVESIEYCGAGDVGRGRLADGRRAAGADAAERSAESAWTERGRGSRSLRRIVLVAVGLIVSGCVQQQQDARARRRDRPGEHPTTTPQTDTTKAKTPARPRIVQPTTTLKPGATGAQVKLLQHALATLGYRPGKVDGRYGPATQRAVIRFQQAEGLTADGIFGAKTKLALAHAG